MKFTEGYIRDLLAGDHTVPNRQTESQVDELMDQLIAERVDIYQQFDLYLVPDKIMWDILRRIFGYVLARAAYVPGDLSEKAQGLVNGFFVEESWIVYSLVHTYGIPYGVVVYFIREVIIFALEHIVSIPTPPVEFA